MLVSCAKCSSRYQLSDDKIKSGGTKVRCPRCQNTFKVFPTAEEEDSDDRTEFFKARPIASESAMPHAASRAMTEIQASHEADSAAKDSAGEFPESVEPTVVRQPIADPAISKKKDRAIEEHSIEEPASDEASDARPFGDATFLAIQKMGSKRQSKRRLLIAASLLIVAAGAGAVLYLRPPGELVPPQAAKLETRPVEPVKISRPSHWYDDDSESLQRLLGQMAALPATEQIEPKNRALIAEALILNGLWSGNFDQVAQGIGYSSTLLASDPRRAYGFYGLATYGLYKDDLVSLSDLVKRWPEGNRTDLEYKLSALYVLGHGPERTKALEQSRDLFGADGAEGFRTSLTVLSIAVESWNEANQIIGEERLESMVRAFQKRRDTLERAQIPMPTLIRNIDRKLQRKVKSLVAEAPPPPPPSPSPATSVEKKDETLAKKVEDSATASLNQRVAEKLKQNSPPPATPPKQTKLPKPSPTLIAANKQEVKEESEAAKLFREGERLLGEKKDDEAILAFQKSLRFDPDFADSYRRLGEIYMTKADKDRALRSLKIYLQLKPDSSDKQLVEGWINSLQ